MAGPLTLASFLFLDHAELLPTSALLLPQPEILSPDLSMAGSSSPSRSQLNCHLLQEASPDHLLWNCHTPKTCVTLVLLYSAPSGIVWSVYFIMTYLFPPVRLQHSKQLSTEYSFYIFVRRSERIRALVPGVQPMSWPGTRISPIQGLYAWWQACLGGFYTKRDQKRGQW